jgi:hypothetical protein
VLVEQSHDADLLVVGHRGRGDSAAPCSGRSACSACCTPPSPSRSSGRGNQPPPWTATPKPGP